MNSKLLGKAGVFVKHVGDFAQANSPTIFAGLAIAGVVGTVAMTTRATLKASEIIHEATVEDPDTGEELKPEAKDIFFMTWKYYVPPVLMAGLTIGAIVASNRILNRRYVALAGLYSVSQDALKDYEAKVTDLFGKSKSDKVHDEIAGDILAKHPVDGKNIQRTGYGDTLCYDPFTDRYFWSDVQMIRKAVNDFNYALNVEFNMSLNELYELMNLNSTYLGDIVGWTADSHPELRPTYRGASDGTPCMVMDFTVHPSPTFRTVY